MRKLKIAFGALVLPAFLLPACNKEPATNDIRLSAMTYLDGGNLITNSFRYDQSGRISKILSSVNNQPESVYFNVSYKGNTIIMWNEYKNDSTIAFDSVTYFVDAANLVQKKIGYRYFENKRLPGVPEQRMFFRDTSLYEYDANGLLTKQTYHHRDSSWADVYGRITADAWLGSEIKIYVNSNHNISSYSKTSDETYYSYEYGSVTVDKSSSTEDCAYSYSKNYPNRTDFSNAAVLNQICGAWPVYPINRNYRNLPDQFTYTITCKDNNGNITRNSYSGNYILKYNSFGFLMSEGDPVRMSCSYSK